MKALEAGLEELARHLAQAGGIFINLFPQKLSDSAARLHFIETQALWAERFLGRPFDRSAFGEMRALAMAAQD